MNFWADIMKCFFLFISIILVNTANSFPSGTNKGFSKIQADYNSGKINFEGQLLQKFYYGFDKSKLAPEYADKDFSPIKCGTEIVMEYYNHKNELSANAINEISQFLTKPFEQTSTSSVYITPSGKFQITYDVTGTNAVPTVDNDSSGIPDYVEWVGSYFDYSWHAEIDSLGYLAPPIGTGTYKVGFANMGYYGYTEPTVGKLTRIVLHNNFIGFPPNTDPEGKQKGAAKVTVAHEFKHATQIMYNNWNEPGWYLEMDATWMEDIAYNQVNDYYNYLSSSQIEYPGRSFDGGDGYEDCLWMHYLSQKFGVLINRQIWERRGISSSELIYDNFNNILAQYTYTFLKGYKEYFTWNYGCGSNTSQHIISYKEAANYPTPTVCNTKTIPDSSAGCGYTELSANYFYYSSINTNKFIKFSYNGTPNTDQSLELIIIYKDNTEEVRDTSIGSSGIINYVLTKKLNDIRAIIAIPIFTTMNSGNYTNSIKVSPFSTAEFTFTPLKDIETNSSRTVKAIVVTEDNIAITDSLKLFYGTSNSSYTEVKMTATGNPNEFGASIPGYPAGTNVNYYFSIYDQLGEYLYFPGNAPIVPYTYFVGIDTKPPNINHVPIVQKTKYDFPFNIFAEVNDNIGIDSVYLEYNVNGGSYIDKSFIHYRDSIYYVQVNADSSITNLGYRIIGTDNSSQKNVKTFPLSDYQQVNIAPGFRFISVHNKTIPDHNIFGTKDTITITDDINIGDIKIKFHASHSRFSDLSARITSPLLKTGYIFKNPGLGTSFENAKDPDITLEQDAYLSIKNFETLDTNAIIGEYIPDTLNLGNFNNYNAKGNWILSVVDNRAGEIGNLIDWGLEIIPSGASDIKTDSRLPEVYYLSQNYPNPFNPSTKIRYSIASGANVELKVFDILGKETALLVKGYKTAGNYEVEFSTVGKAFSSGIYFYRLTAGNFSSVKKLIILK
jgi:subtilisin-like proprotein convertase family protein